MPSAIEMWVIAAIDLANGSSISRCFIGAYRYFMTQPHPFNCFVEKTIGRLGIASLGEAEIDHLAICHRYGVRSRLHANQRSHCASASPFVW